MPVVDIVNAIREAFDQLRFRFANGEPFRVWVPWRGNDPLTGRAGWTKAINTTLCRIGQEFGFETRVSRYDPAGGAFPDGGELLWDITWLEEDNQGRMVDMPLVAECEFAFDPVDEKILPDFEKLMLARAGVRLMVHEHWSERGTREPIDPPAMAGYLAQHVQAFGRTQAEDVYLLAVLEHVPEGEEYEYHRIRYFRLKTDGTAVEWVEGGPSPFEDLEC